MTRQAVKAAGGEKSEVKNPPNPNRPWRPLGVVTRQAVKAADGERRGGRRRWPQPNNIIDSYITLVVIEY